MQRLVRCRKGATAIEYALIAAMVGVGAMVALDSTGKSISGTYCAVASAMPAGSSCGEPPAPPAPPPPPRGMSIEDFALYGKMPLTPDQEYFNQQYDQCVSSGHTASMVFNNGRFNNVSCR